MMPRDLFFNRVTFFALFSMPCSRSFLKTIFKPLYAILLHFGSHFSSFFAPPGPQGDVRLIRQLPYGSHMGPFWIGSFLKVLPWSSFLTFFRVFRPNVIQIGLPWGTQRPANERRFSSLFLSWRALGTKVPPGVPQRVPSAASELKKVPKWSPKTSKWSLKASKIEVLGLHKYVVFIQKCVPSLVSERSVLRNFLPEKNTVHTTFPLALQF